MLVPPLAGTGDASSGAAAHWTPLGVHPRTLHWTVDGTVNVSPSTHSALCNHPDRPALDAALDEGMNLPEVGIERRYGVSDNSANGGTSRRRGPVCCAGFGSTAELNDLLAVTFRSGS